MQTYIRCCPNRRRAYLSDRKHVWLSIRGQNRTPLKNRDSGIGKDDNRCSNLQSKLQPFTALFLLFMGVVQFHDGACPLSFGNGRNCKHWKILTLPYLASVVLRLWMFMNWARERLMNKLLNSAKFLSNLPCKSLSSLIHAPAYHTLFMGLGTSGTRFPGREGVLMLWGKGSDRCRTPWAYASLKKTL